MRARLHLLRLTAALAAAAALSAIPAAAHQLAKQQKQAAAAPASGAPSGTSPLHVMLVVSDAVRAYRVSLFLNHVDFGRALATQVEKDFRETFVSVNTVSALPADAGSYAGIDLVVVVEVPQGDVRTGFFSNPMTLNAGFVVRSPKGVELFRLRESANDNAQNLYHGRDRLVEAVCHQFVQDMMSNVVVRNILTPPAPVETKPVLADTAAMESSGLDVPPPAPWAAPAGPVPGGKP